MHPAAVVFFSLSAALTALVAVTAVYPISLEAVLNRLYTHRIDRRWRHRIDPVACLPAPAQTPAPVSLPR